MPKNLPKKNEFWTRFERVEAGIADLVSRQNPQHDNTLSEEVKSLRTFLEQHFAEPKKDEPPIPPKPTRARGWLDELLFGSKDNAE